MGAVAPIRYWARTVSLAAVAGQRGGDAVVVLLEPVSLDAALDRPRRAGQLLAQDPLGLVLRQRDESERHVGRQRQLELRRPLAVDVDELAAHLDRRVQDAPQHTHALEDLERARLHANRFRVLRRFAGRVDDPAADAPAGEFDGGGQADRAGAGDQYIGVGSSARADYAMPP